MKTTNIVLPDKTCVTIEGGDAEAVANVLQNQYLKNTTVQNVPGGAGDGEPVLDMPFMTFADALKAEDDRQAKEAAAKKAAAAQAAAAPAANSDAEPVLALPSLV